MGADLICYIAFGPRRINLDGRREVQVARQVREYLDACIAAAEQLLLGDEEVPDPRKKPVEAKRGITLRLESSAEGALPTFSSLEQLRSSPDYVELVRRVLTDSGHEVEAGRVFDGTEQDIAAEVRGFVADWNEGRFRDLAYREDPTGRGRKVVVAGELSWGDEPQGRGYQMLKKAFGLTVAQRLGVT